MQERITMRKAKDQIIPLTVPSRSLDRERRERRLLRLGEIRHPIPVPWVSVVWHFGENLPIRMRRSLKIHTAEIENPSNWTTDRLHTAHHPLRQKCDIIFLSLVLASHVFNQPPHIISFNHLSKYAQLAALMGPSSWHRSKTGHLPHGASLNPCDMAPSTRLVALKAVPPITFSTFPS